jgi:putative alpha-1,2-mannosidase
MFIQSATVNDKAWNKPWFSHSDIANGGKLVLNMDQFRINIGAARSRRSVPVDVEAGLMGLGQEREVIDEA